MWVVPAGLAWSWPDEDPEIEKPEIVGPFLSVEDAIAYLRRMFPLVEDQTQPGTEPDSAYLPYVAQLLSPDGGFRIPMEDMVDPDDGGMSAQGEQIIRNREDL